MAAFKPCLGSTVCGGSLNVAGRSTQVHAAKPWEPRWLLSLFCLCCRPPHPAMPKLKQLAQMPWPKMATCSPEDCYYQAPDPWQLARLKMHSSRQRGRVSAECIVASHRDGRGGHYGSAMAEYHRSSHAIGCAAKPHCRGGEDKFFYCLWRRQVASSMS